MHFTSLAILVSRSVQFHFKFTANTVVRGHHVRRVLRKNVPPLIRSVSRGKNSHSILHPQNPFLLSRCRRRRRLLCRRVGRIFPGKIPQFTKYDLCVLRRPQEYRDRDLPREPKCFDLGQVSARRNLFSSSIVYPYTVPWFGPLSVRRGRP